MQQLTQESIVSLRGDPSLVAVHRDYESSNTTSSSAGSELALPQLHQTRVRQKHEFGPIWAVLISALAVWFLLASCYRTYKERVGPGNIGRRFSALEWGMEDDWSLSNIFGLCLEMEGDFEDLKQSPNLLTNLPQGEALKASEAPTSAFWETLESGEGSFGDLGRAASHPSPFVSVPELEDFEQSPNLRTNLPQDEAPKTFEASTSAFLEALESGEGNSPKLGSPASHPCPFVSGAEFEDLEQSPNLLTNLPQGEALRTSEAPTSAFWETLESGEGSFPDLGRRASHPSPFVSVPELEDLEQSPNLRTNLPQDEALKTSEASTSAFSEALEFGEGNFPKLGSPASHPSPFVSSSEIEDLEESPNLPTNLPQGEALKTSEAPNSAFWETLESGERSFPELGSPASHPSPFVSNSAFEYLEQSPDLLTNLQQDDVLKTFEAPTLAFLDMLESGEGNFPELGSPASHPSPFVPGTVTSVEEMLGDLLSAPPQKPPGAPFQSDTRSLTASSASITSRDHELAGEGESSVPFTSQTVGHRDETPNFHAFAIPRPNRRQIESLSSIVHDHAGYVRSKRRSAKVVFISEHAFPGPSGLVEPRKIGHHHSLGKAGSAPGRKKRRADETSAEIVGSLVPFTSQNRSAAKESTLASSGAPHALSVSRTGQRTVYLTPSTSSKTKYKPPEPAPKQLLSTPLDYRLPRVEGKVEATFDSSCISPDASWATASPRELSEMKKILEMEVLQEAEAERLLFLAEVVASELAHDHGSSVEERKPSHAVYVLGRRFVLLELLFCTVQVMERDAMTPEMWWSELMNMIETNFGSVQTYAREKYKDLTQRVSQALNELKKGTRPSEGDTIALKNDLFRRTDSPKGFKRKMWNSWRRGNQQ